MNKLRTLTLLTTVALGLALVGVAHADEKPLIVTEPFEEVFPNPCTGETVILAGEVLVILHQTEDGAGGFHETFTLVPHGVTATGASGTQYRAVGAHSDAFNTGPGRATTFTLSVTFNVISKGGTTTSSPRRLSTSQSTRTAIRLRRSSKFGPSAAAEARMNLVLELVLI